MELEKIEGNPVMPINTRELVENNIVPLEHSPFSKLFEQRPDVLEAIQEHMEKNGYDESQPIVLGKGAWTWEDFPMCQKRLWPPEVVIDGHSRLRAALKIGIDRITIVKIHFDSEEEARLYAIHLQKDRRNLGDAEILACVEMLDNRKSHGGDRHSENFKASHEALKGKTSETIAQTLGIGRPKVDKTLAVLDHADEQTKEAVKSGKLSINSAYNETRKKKRGGETERESGEKLKVGIREQTCLAIKEVYLRIFSDEMLDQCDNAGDVLHLHEEFLDELERLIEEYRDKAM